jgi:hypothetical protein
MKLLKRSRRKSRMQSLSLRCVSAHLLFYLSHIYTLSQQVEEESHSYAAPAAAAVAGATAGLAAVSLGNSGKASAVETFSVTMLDAKKKKKKGTLGVGNGALFFASESDKVHFLGSVPSPLCPQTTD